MISASCTPFTQAVDEPYYSLCCRWFSADTLGLPCVLWEGSPLNKTSGSITSAPSTSHIPAKSWPRPSTQLSNFPPLSGPCHIVLPRSVPGHFFLSLSCLPAALSVCQPASSPRAWACIASFKSAPMSQAVEAHLPREDFKL